MTQLELITQGYWTVSHAIRGPIPNPLLTTSRALRLVKDGDLLPPESWRLKDLMHVAKFDIIEGNTQWRQESNNLKNSSTLIPFMRN